MAKISADVLEKLAAVEASAPPEPRSAVLTEGDLGEEIGKITDDTGALGAVRRVKGDDDWESYVTIYSTLDGSPSKILRGMLPKKLRQRFTSQDQVPAEYVGKPAFSRSPIMEYDKGSFLCPLHVDAPERAQMDKIGLGSRTCRKSNLRTEFDRINHLKHRHGREFAIIEASRVATEQARMREAQEAQTAMMAALVEAMKKDK